MPLRRSSRWGSPRPRYELEFELIEPDTEARRPGSPDTCTRTPSRDRSRQHGRPEAARSSRLFETCKAPNIPGRYLQEFSPGQFSQLHQCHADSRGHGVLLKRAGRPRGKHGMARAFLPSLAEWPLQMHVHISLVDANGKNIRRHQQETSVRESLRHAIGGLRESLPNPLAIFAPTSNRTAVPPSSSPARTNCGATSRRRSGSPVGARTRASNTGPAWTATHLVLAAIISGVHQHPTRRAGLGGPVNDHRREYRTAVRWSGRWMRSTQERSGRIPWREFPPAYGTAARGGERFHSEISDRDYEWSCARCSLYSSPIR